MYIPNFSVHVPSLVLYLVKNPNSRATTKKVFFLGMTDTLSDERKCNSQNYQFKPKKEENSERQK